MVNPLWGMLRHHAMNYGCGTQPLLTREFCQEKKTHQHANLLQHGIQNNKQTSKIIRFWKASGFVCKPWVFEQTLQKLWFWICKVYVYINISLSLYLPVCLSVCLSVYVSAHLFLYLSWCLTICLCVHVSICLSRHLFL